MLVAFEGPDKALTSTSARKLGGLGFQGMARPNRYEQAKLTKEVGLVQTFDTISWITDFAHTLIYTDKLRFNDYSGDKPFAMPDTHLVFKLPRGPHENQTTDFSLKVMSQAYYYIAHTLMAINELRDYELFKTISIMEVSTGNLPFNQRMAEFSSPLIPWVGSPRLKLVHDDMSLYDLLLEEEAAR